MFFDGVIKNAVCMSCIREGNDEQICRQRFKQIRLTVSQQMNDDDDDDQVSVEFELEFG